MKAELLIEARELLKQLIALPSFSREEKMTADLLENFFRLKNISTHRLGNNVWVSSRDFDSRKPTLLLNSHHDTVKPCSGWEADPFGAVEKEGKITGLGSNDAGASLCALIAAFLFYEGKELPVNLIFAATAEEEISGEKGVSAILPALGKIDAAIVGEPTGMNLAVAEKGLLVLDCLAKGKAGHAARDEGENAIYAAMEDIRWFSEFRFPKVSSWLGAVKMSVTQIAGGKQHNVVPDSCAFTVDIRVTDLYTHEEILGTIRQHVKSALAPRSLRLRSSSIGLDHPLVKAAEKAGCSLFGSPTLSDQALMPFPSVKIGPGNSARSHTANEFIYLHELEEGIKKYIALIGAYAEEQLVGSDLTAKQIVQ